MQSCESPANVLCLQLVAYRWLAPLVCASTLAACSLVTSLDGLTSGGAADAGAAGLSSGAGDAAASSSGGAVDQGGGSSSSGGGISGIVGQDGGDPPQDATVSDDDSGMPLPSGSDAGGTAAVDAGHTVGSSDAGSTSHDSGPPPGFCASLSPAPLFCDDFDEGAALASPWDQLSSTGGSEALSSASCVSSPDAMLVTVNPNASVNAIDLAGYKSFTSKQGASGTAMLTFELKINAADTSSASDVILGAIQLWNGSAYFDVELEAFYVSSSNDFKVSMSEYGSTGSYVQHFATSHVPLGAWTKVAIGITLPAAAGGSAPATLSLNGSNVVSVTVDVTTSDPIPEILVGTTYATPTSGGWSIAYDNVTFDEK